MPYHPWVPSPCLLLTRLYNNTAYAQVAGTGSGSGSSPIWTTPQIHTVAGIVTQGQQGDLDFPSGGDGKWNINWSFVACPGGAAYQGSGSEGSTTEKADNNLVRASQAAGGSSSTSRKLLEG